MQYSSLEYKMNQLIQYNMIWYKTTFLEFNTI